VSAMRHYGILSPPREILVLLVNWDVSDLPHEQFVAALTISSVIALFIYGIFHFVAIHVCHKRTSGENCGKEKTLWTVHNKRYDLKSFVKAHPGGRDAILLGQGRNCTELFESYHSLADEKRVRATLAAYYVEDAAPGDEDYDVQFQWGDTPFYDALKARVRTYFEQRQGATSPGRYAGYMQWVQLVGFTGASGVALWSFMHAEVAGMAALPFVYWWGPSPCMHDGGHFALSPYPWINRLCAHLGGAHMSLFSWYHQHTIGHHSHTNIVGWDPDLYHFSLGTDTGMPGFRTSLQLRTLPEQPDTKQTRADWLLLGLLLRVPCTTFGPSVIWDTMSLVGEELSGAYLGLVPFWIASRSRLLLHAMGRVLVIWLAIVHPITVCLVTATTWPTGVCMAAAFVMVPYAIHGCLFYVFSQVSHVQHECQVVKPGEADENKWHHPHPCHKNEYPVWGQLQQMKPSNRNQLLCNTVQEHNGRPIFPPAAPIEWAAHQVGTTLDYAVDSLVWLHLSNGLNLQAVHHLFPQVGWGHYVGLAPIIRDTCAEFGVQYSTAPSFSSALRLHYSYLHEINAGTSASVWATPHISSGKAPAAALYIHDQLDMHLLNIARAPPPPPDEGVWQRATDASGNVYEYNTQTRESRWVVFEEPLLRKQLDAAGHASENLSGAHDATQRKDV